MFVKSEGKDSIVELLGDGSVREYTSKDTYNLYSIQIEEGKPISWVMTKETVSKDSESSKMMNDDFKPMAQPTETEAKPAGAGTQSNPSDQQSNPIEESKEATTEI